MAFLGSLIHFFTCYGQNRHSGTTTTRKLFGRRSVGRTLEPASCRYHCDRRWSLPWFVHGCLVKSFWSNADSHGCSRSAMKSRFTDSQTRSFTVGIPIFPLDVPVHTPRAYPGETS